MQEELESLDWGLDKLPGEESSEAEISLGIGLCFDGGVFDNRSQVRAGLEKVGKVSWVGASA